VVGAPLLPQEGRFHLDLFRPANWPRAKGRRPALVVSNDLFNKHTGLAIVCPITNTDRGFPFHLPIPAASPLTGFVMVEQLKSVDFSKRRAKFIHRAPPEFLEDVLDMIDVCIR
jgi:mRNA interferase MazF